MTEQKHTPEPWVYTPTNTEDVSHIIRAPDGRGVATATKAQARKAQNARRIVACVNACEEIPTEALESGVIGEMLEALRLVNEHYGEDSDVFWVVRAAIAKAKGETQ